VFTTDATLKFVLLHSQTGKASCRFRIASRHQSMLDAVQSQDCRMRLDRAVSSPWIPNVRVPSFALSEQHLDFTAEFQIRDWPDVRFIRKGFLHESVVLHLEPMQTELFREDVEPIGTFFNHRMRWQRKGVTV